jgi:hypothetical protein
MLNSIKKYFKKAKEEVSREYAIGSPGPARADASGALDTSTRDLPRIWTGVDLDGTLAHYSRTANYGKVGEPVPAMLALVKKMINNGIRVKIFTARVEDPDQVPIIRKWLQDNGLPDLEITNIKDYGMQRLYDDRCIQVEINTGRLIVDD